MTTVGIDVGGTKCHGVVADEKGAVVAELRRPTPHAGELIDLLAEMHRELGGGSALGIGVPGLVTPEGIIKASPNLKGAHDIEVGPRLRSALGIPVHVENDATSAAYAEWRVGAARGTDDALIVTLGTGIGGGVVMGGQLQRGAHGFAGEIGHMVVEADGIECVCGRRGCWERYASGSALKRLSGGMPGEEVFSRAMNGEEGSLAVVDDFARWFCIGVASLTNVLDPQVVVVGGGVVDAWSVLHPAIARWLDRLLYSSDNRPQPTVRPAELGPRAGAIGIALLAADAA
ncbi:MAG: glucokinase [Actinomycetota bacterium]|jgi:glucokinase